MPEAPLGLLTAAFQQPYAAYLLSCDGRAIHPHDRYLWLLGWGGAPLTALDALATAPDWRFGLLPYYLGQRFEPTAGLSKSAPINWPEVAFFQAAGVVGQRRSGTPLAWGEVLKPAAAVPVAPHLPSFHSGMTEAAYLASVRALQAHIRAGDCYEVNLTQPFVSEGAVLDPLATFQALVAASPAPMAALLKFQDRWLISTSPERFLRLQDGRLVTQPIKGTKGRSSNPEQSPDEDNALAKALLAGEKERAENVMIVDLARNDLHRVCHAHSVEVEHLFELQSFARLHHLVSTIAGEPKAGVGLVATLAATFPPGSMTGAPKVAAMQLIERYEVAGRGGYSGSVGYIEPSGDFDFNVVIRSLLYDAAQHRACYHAGGAITIDSDPADELAELHLKAAALRAALERL